MIRDPSQFLAAEVDSSIPETGLVHTANNNSTDILMTDCSKLFQTSPSQFNGFSLRWMTKKDPSKNVW
jgi:hypothetical protein